MIDVNLAIQLAGRSLHAKSKHAAIVFHKGEIIAIANNSKEKHAEIRALEIARINFGYLYEQGDFFSTDAVLISIAITKTGKLKLAKPCPKCLAYLKLQEYKTIYYSTNNQTIIKLK
jgi:tRNA(Arg) A34 adenosine deaminase TadA